MPKTRDACDVVILRFQTWFSASVRSPLVQARGGPPRGALCWPLRRSAVNRRRGKHNVESAFTTKYEEWLFMFLHWWMGVMERSELGVGGVVIVGPAEGPGEKRLFLSARLNSCINSAIKSISFHFFRRRDKFPMKYNLLTSLFATKMCAWPHDLRFWRCRCWRSRPLEKASARESHCGCPGRCFVPIGRHSLVSES